MREPLDKLFIDKDRLIEIFEKEYIKSGYMYGGCLRAYGHILSRIFGYPPIEVLFELVDEGKLERRNCDAFAFQLPIGRRAELIDQHNLAERWEREAPYFYPNSEHGEVFRVMNERKREVER